MRDELRDDSLWDERASQAFLRGLERLLDSYDRLYAATVHVLHHKVYHSFVVENSVILNLSKRAVTTLVDFAYKLGAGLVEHLEFVVKLVPLVFVVQVDDLPFR